MELSLVPHPEGGWYRRTYESRESVSLQRGERACSSSILYFLKTNERSCLHQLKSDEIWYFHWEARSEFINLIRENIPKLFWELILICKTNPNIFFLQVPFLGPNAWGRGVVR